MADELYRQIRERALSEGRTVTSFIEESVREALARRSSSGPVDFVVSPFEGTGVQPGVDLTDSTALLDVMER